MGVWEAAVGQQKIWSKGSLSLSPTPKIFGPKPHNRFGLVIAARVRGARGAGSVSACVPPWATSTSGKGAHSLSGSGMLWRDGQLPPHPPTPSGTRLGWDGDQGSHGEPRGGGGPPPPPPPSAPPSTLAAVFSRISAERQAPGDPSIPSPPPPLPPPLAAARAGEAVSDTDMDMPGQTGGGRQAAASSGHPCPLRRSGRD